MEERQIKAQALRDAAGELLLMTMDPTDLMTTSIGSKGPITVALWLLDRAARVELGEPEINS